MLAAAAAAFWAPPAPLAKSAEPSCFAGLVDHAQAARIARNTVFIAEVGTGGTLLSAGTGFAVQGTNGVRIVTARHVIDSGVNGSTFIVLFSDGVPLGVPGVAAAGSAKKIEAAGVDLTVNDIAVLRIDSFSSPAAEKRFAALDGLSVRANGPLMVGETTGVAGVAWGYSGAAGVDAEGRVAGVLTGADFRGRVSLILPSIQEADASGELRGRPAALPNRSLAVVEPIHGEAILRELKLAAIEPGDGEETRVVFAGFPSANCASASAVLQAVDSKAGTKLLKLWASTDQEGAWWLPAPFSISKLNFSYKPR
ncbi:MAG: hypothetical protein ACLPIX_09910 [Rhodomicrobium sp.]